MDTRKVIDKLNDLIKLDVDAVHAYEAAIEACEVDEIRNRLNEFRGDHERHIRDLSAQVRACGGEPDVRRDFKGFFIEGFTKVVSQGDHSALLVMRGNEELTNRTYAAALKLEGLSAEARTVLERNFADEERHLNWIVDQLDERAWEKKAA